MRLMILIKLLMRYLLIIYAEHWHKWKAIILIFIIIVAITGARMERKTAQVIKVRWCDLKKFKILSLSIT